MSRGRAVYLILCYDVVSDRRRGQLHRRLKGWLQPVQKSVFEGEIGPRKLDPLLVMVRDIIDNGTDTVRVYMLCGGCRTSTILVGPAQPCRSGNEPLII